MATLAVDALGAEQVRALATFDEQEEGSWTGVRQLAKHFGVERPSSKTATVSGVVQETLERLSLESERVQIHELARNEFERIPKIFDDFAETIDEHIAETFVISDLRAPRKARPSGRRLRGGFARTGAVAAGRGIWAVPVWLV